MSDAEWVLLADLAPGLAIIGNAPNGTEGEVYSYDLDADGGVPPYTFSIVGGALPDGLSMDSTGLISGTPTTGETVSFTVKATDATGASAIAEFTISITEAVVMEEWAGYFTATAQAAKVSGSHTNFPAYYDLSDAPAEFWANVASDGADLRATDSGGNEIALELVAIDDVAETGEIHFKAPTMEGGSVFRLYAGNGTATAPAVGSTYGRNAVWTDYAAVWHLQEDPTGTAPQAVDSTGNGYDLTAQSLTSGSLVDGQIEKCWDFPFDNDRAESGADIVTVESLESSISCSAWAKTDAASAVVLFSQDDGTGKGLHFYVDYANGNTAGAWRINLDAGGELKNTSSPYWPFNNQNWQLYRCQYDGTAMTLMVGDVVNDSKTVSTTVRTEDNFRISGWGNNNLDWFGAVDEFRIKRTPVSNDWHLTEWNNQVDPSSFWSTGAWVAN